MYIILINQKITAQIIEQGDKRDRQLKEIYLNQVDGPKGVAKKDKLLRFDELRNNK